MIIKPKEIEIPEKDPFRNDALDRKESAQALTEFVLSTNDPLVVCIDAPWGQGKTTFLRMWRQYLKDRDIPTIYFNAWENDFSDNAMISLIGEISTSLSELDKKNKSKTKVNFDEVKRIGKILMKKSIPFAIKISTSGILNMDEAAKQELAKFIESLAKEQTDQYEDFIEQYKKSKKSVQEFREALSAFTASISTEEDRKPLIFIIDELDRCRPDYAIEVLEKAKHFFNVKNLVFVLGAHKGQLGTSIKSIYGEGLDANGYLRRFIDFDYHLPPPDKGEFVTVLFRKYGFSEYFSQKEETGPRREYEQALAMFKELFELYKLTLREQEHCCSLLSVAIRTTPYDRHLFPFFLCFLIVLKIKKPSLYNEFINEEQSQQKVLDHIYSLPGGNELLNNNYGTSLEAYIITCKPHPYGRRKIDEYLEIRDSDSSSDHQKRRIYKILETTDSIRSRGIDVLPYLVEKIEIATRFQS